MDTLLPSLTATLLQITTEQIIRIVVFIVILLVVWAVMKAVLRITMRLFAFGCGAIVVLGLVLVLMRIFTQ